MQSPEFADLLGKYVEALGTDTKELVDAICKESSQTVCPNRTTVDRWLSGQTKKPRDHEAVRYCVRYLKKALQLSEEQATELLSAAGIGPSTPDMKGPLTHYRDTLAARCRTHPLFAWSSGFDVADFVIEAEVLMQPRSHLSPHQNMEPEQLSGLRFLLEAPEGQRIIILGQPGAGKSTLLQRTAIELAASASPTIPILIEFRRWAAAKKPFPLLEYIVSQLPSELTPKVLDWMQDGRIYLLLDAFDELPTEELRGQVIEFLNDFAPGRPYARCRLALTSRVGALQATFVQEFTYVQMAPFSKEHSRMFVSQWEGISDDQRNRLHTALDDSRYSDLGSNPLLLTMLCAVVRRDGDMPQKRHEVYETALGILLKQWDRARGIQRGVEQSAGLYRDLTTERKHQLFAYVAHTTFERGQVVIPGKDLAQLITQYLSALPGYPSAEDIEGEDIFQAIVTQHGILIPHDSVNYTFTHLSLQEYYAAYHIVHSDSSQAIPELLAHANEDRWHEVIRLAVSMLDNANAFFECFLAVLDRLVKDSCYLGNFLTWINDQAASAGNKQASYNNHPAAFRAYYASLYCALGLVIGCRYDREALAIVLALARDLDLDHNSIQEFPLGLNLSRNQMLALVRATAHIRDVYRAFKRKFAHNQKRACFLDFDLDRTLARELAQKLCLEDLSTMLSGITPPSVDESEKAWAIFTNKLRVTLEKHHGFCFDWNFNGKQATAFKHYCIAARHLVLCLDITEVTDRAAIEDRLLLPPTPQEQLA